MTTDRAIEDDIKAAGADRAPRITPADIEAAIVSENGFTVGAALRAIGGHPTHPSHDLVTLCVLVLRNGFTVVGTSAPASPENFSAEIGYKVARADAINQVWPLLGYELRTKLQHLAQYGTGTGAGQTGPEA